MGSDRAARLHSVNRYSAEQTNESAVNEAADRIHGGENIHRAECSVQSRRNKQRGNYYHPGYIMNTLIFLLLLLGSTLGADISRVERDQPPC